MAIAATTEWDVQTGGDNANGGGFDTASSGTDYSQQTSPQVTYTDLVIDATTNTKCTSAATPFTSAHVGNVINITSGTGFTVQRVQVVSVLAGVATCDKSLGTLSSTGGNGKLGGCLLTLGTALGSGTWTSGNKIHVKAGTYTITSAISWNTDTGSVEVRGYGTTHNDGGTKPLITTATNSTILITCSGSTSSTLTLINLSMSNTAATRASGVKATVAYTLVMQSCILDGFTRGLDGDTGSAFSDLYVYNTEVKNSTAHGISQNGNAFLYAVHVHDTTNSGDGFHSTTNSTFKFHRCIFNANAGKGVATNGSNANCRITMTDSACANNTSDGLNYSGSTAQPINVHIINNVFYGNGAYGVNVSSSLKASMNVANAYGGNTTAARNNLAAGIGDITLTASPFTSSTNFSPNNTSGGGALLRAVRVPSTWVDGVQIDYGDLGPVQHNGAIMGDIKQKFGTGNQSLTITIASLTNGSARQSTEVDNSSNVYGDALVFLKIKTGASGTASTGFVSVYAFASVDGGTSRTENAGASDAAITPTVPTNLRSIGIINCVANATTYYGGPMSVAAAFGGVMPERWGIVIKNETGGTLDTTGGNHAAIWQGVYGQYT